MQRLTEHKIILVRRKTRLEELLARHNTVEQARFYVEHLGSDFTDYLEEDALYRTTIHQAEEVLSSLGRLQIVEREYVPGFFFGKQDIVVVIGQDGLVANTLKYLDGQPLVGINPDPKRWDGILLPFTVHELSTLLPDVFAKKRPLKEVSMAKVSLNDGQTLYAVNDLFIGQRTHVSARYHIRHGTVGETQSSSGIIVSTGLGATGWLKSIVVGANEVVNSFTRQNRRAAAFTPPAWNADYLHFSVREPFPSRSTAATVVFGSVSKQQPLCVVSHMPENGVIFSDGIEKDFLDFRAGVEATIGIAEKKGYLVA